MAGIYIHIPFCKKACHYCNFHFSTSLKLKNDFLAALFQEIKLRKNYLGNEPISTLYLGGGSPSLLNITDLKQLLEQLNKSFDLQDIKEFTIEANPDDLSVDYLNDLKQLNSPAVSRLSIGIQSFNDKDLLWMNRTHNANEAIACLKNSKSAGFNNLNIDLIYGIPSTISNSFKQNVDAFLEFDIPHLSAYCLTVEANTPLAHQIKNKLSAPVNEAQASQEMAYLINHLKKNSYEQYEISNFAKAQQYALHNTNYWQNKKYLGLGPSAHSFNGFKRQWNVANNALYIKKLAVDIEGVDFFTEEVLSRENRFNEYIMTALRTKWGVDLNYIEENFDGTFIVHLLKTLQTTSYKKGIHYSLIEENLCLLDEGKLMADGIASSLFLV